MNAFRKKKSNLQKAHLLHTPLIVCNPALALQLILSHRHIVQLVNELC